MMSEADYIRKATYDDEIASLKQESECWQVELMNEAAQCERFARQLTEANAKISTLTRELDEAIQARKNVETFCEERVARYAEEVSLRMQVEDDLCARVEALTVESANLREASIRSGNALYEARKERDIATQAWRAVDAQRTKDLTALFKERSALRARVAELEANAANFAREGDTWKQSSCKMEAIVRETDDANVALRAAVEEERAACLGIAKHLRIRDAIAARKAP